MNSLTRVSILLALIVALAAPLNAAQKQGAPTDKKPAAEPDKKPAVPRDKKPADPNRQKKSAGVSRKGFQLPGNVRSALTPEQSEKAAQIEQEYAAKLNEAATTIHTILTPERRKAQAEAAARALDGLLSDQEKTDLKAAQESLGTLQVELRGKIMELLTDEQKSQLKKRRNADDKKVRQPNEKSTARGQRLDPIRSTFPEN